MTTATEKDRSNSVAVRGFEFPEARIVGAYAIDISEESLATRGAALLPHLLFDRATGRNIVWATEHYRHLGDAYAPECEITVESITGDYRFLIQPRVEKSKAERWDRTKGRAEVFTPAWLCNEQNNHVDEAWFGRSNVFNTPAGQSWIPCSGPISFDVRGRRTWKAYVDDRRLEAACGEGPYLVSRYDAVTGESIRLDRRIGLLDRKLRIVTENTHDADEWRKWARRAVESVYGFEYHGDSLLLARENLLATYEDYAVSALGVEPTAAELTRIAKVISWNIWQMDLLTGRSPLQNDAPYEHRFDLFGDLGDEVARLCRIRDWRAKRTHYYVHLTSAEGGAP